MPLVTVLKVAVSTGIPPQATGIPGDIPLTNKLNGNILLNSVQYNFDVHTMDMGEGESPNRGDERVKVFMAEFSTTGNTRYLGALLEHEFSRRSHIVTRVPLEKEPLKPRLPEVDLVCIGSPVYHNEPASTVMRYLCALEGRGIPLVSYFTKGLYSGDCARIFALEAEAVGFRPVGNIEAVMPGSDMVMMTSEASLLARMNLRVTRNLPRKVRAFVEGLDLETAPTPNPGAAASIPAPKWYTPLNNFAKHFAVPGYEKLKGRLRADPDRCNEGYWCIRNCPEHAIRPSDGAVSFRTDRCILCLRCYHGCPVQAIYLEDSKDSYRKKDDRKAGGHYAGPQTARGFEAVAEYKPQRIRCGEEEKEG